MTQRTLIEKIADVKSTYHQFSDMLTPPELRAMLDGLTGPEAQEAVGQSGDVKLLAQVVHASMELQQVISANNRTALIAATTVAGSGGTRITPEE